MINYYEYLELDMNASVDELNHAIQKVSERDDADLKFIREMKSILLNDEARVLYNNKLISFIVGDRKKSDFVSAENIRKLLNIDSSSLHEKYIWIATGLFVVGVLSACLFSLAVNYTVNLFVMIALVILFYMDWKLLDKHDKASFSIWWILFSPVYIAKRCKAVGQGKMLLLVWLGIWVVYGIGNFAFNGSKAMLERTACEVVTDIYHKQLRQYSQQCENVTLTESEGKQHYGFAQLSDGTTKDITVTEQSDGKIVVYIE